MNQEILEARFTHDEIVRKYNRIASVYDLFGILPVEDFMPILLEFKRVIKDGVRIVLANMTKGERWLNQIYEEIYKLKPPLLAGYRGVFIQSFLEKIGFKDIQREFVSQLGFPSEVV